MLDNLEEVDWSSLKHAHGVAADVPGLLRSLASSEPKVREESIYELFGNIWHQGTVYPATAAAVPFLYALLTAPDVEDKPSIAHLLACIADGSGYLEVHAAIELGGVTWRKILSDQGRSLDDELAREAAEIQSVRRAASSGLRHLLPYLVDAENEIRRSIATALGNYLAHSGWSLPAIEAAVESEQDEEVVDALAESFTRLSGHRA